MTNVNIGKKITITIICLLIFIPFSFILIDDKVRAIPAPTLVAPSNGSATTDDTPSLDWMASGSIIQSQVQVDTNDFFVSPEINEVISGSGTFYTCSALSDDTYYWRVRVMDDIEFTYSSWSAVWSFTIDTTGPTPPSLIYPLGETANSDPTFDWSDVGDAVEYRIMMDESDTFSSPNFDSTTANSYLDCPVSLSYGQTYYWRVRGKDSLNNWGSWSSASSFIYTFNSGPPTLLLPVNNSYTSNPTITFDWTDVIGCQGYRIQVDYNSYEFGTYLRLEFPSVSEYTTTFINDYTYYWRVCSQSDGGMWGPYSTINRVVLDRVAPVISDVIAIPDTLDDNDVISVYCNVTDNHGISDVSLHYRVNGGGWTTVSMSWVIDNLYEGVLGSFNYDDFVEYYITAEDIASPANVATENNGGSYYSFTVAHNDHTAPIISSVSHAPSDPTDLQEIMFNCSATDANGIQSVILHYSIEEGPWNTAEATLLVGSTYSVTIGPFDYSDHIEYYFSATDDSPNHNEGINDNGGFYYHVLIMASDTTGPSITDVNYYPAAPTQLDVVTVNCTVTDPNGINFVWLYFKYNDFPIWLIKEMTLVSGNTYETTINAYPYGYFVQFYILAQDNYPTHNTATNDNGGAYFTYTVAHSDVYGPEITDIQHSPLVTVEDSPINITCTVTDDFGVLFVTLYYRINYGSWLSVNMTLLSADTFSHILGPYVYGFTIDYYIYAMDNAPYHNTATDDNSGSYYHFDIVSSDVLGPTIQDVYHLPATPTDATSVTIYATVNDTNGLQAVILCFRLNEGIWVNVSMTLVSAELYAVELGLFDFNDTVHYYVIAIDNSPNANSQIDNNEGSYYFFNIESSDVTGPIISDIHQSAENITVSDSITISCLVTDENGVASVKLYYRIDYGSWIMVVMTEGSENNYSITLDGFSAGDFVQFYIEAVDDSVINNLSVDNNSGDYYFFKVEADPITPTPTTTTTTNEGSLFGGVLSFVIVIAFVFGSLRIIKPKKKLLN